MTVISELPPELQEVRDTLTLTQRRIYDASDSKIEILSSILEENTQLQKKELHIYIENWANPKAAFMIIDKITCELEIEEHKERKLQFKQNETIKLNGIGNG
ncbi:hypothetical protein C1645_736963 [Glomus cerebriforme]|uniref:Uncharacterized protein n=1 Tax=Glomus cerebriforme TaxID=658196 RepID=A0A397T618_9GLOM|nr:hypothetical protein C1645_736963 [Glomus cerebriforme]